MTPFIVGMTTNGQILAVNPLFVLKREGPSLSDGKLTLYLDKRSVFFAHYHVVTLTGTQTRAGAPAPAAAWGRAAAADDDWVSVVATDGKSCTFSRKALVKIDPVIGSTGTCTGTCLALPHFGMGVHLIFAPQMPGDIRRKLGIPEPGDSATSAFLPVAPAQGPKARAEWYNLEHAAVMEANPKQPERTTVCFAEGALPDRNRIFPLRLTDILRRIGTPVPAEAARLLAKLPEPYKAPAPA